MRKLTLQEWSENYFARPRKPRTLYLYIHNGQIYPAPVKVGRDYEVDPHAIFLDKNVMADPQLLQEKINGQKKKQRQSRLAAKLV